MEIDLLHSLSVDTLKLAIWLMAIALGLILAYVHRNWYWPLFEAVLTFMIMSFGTFIYIVTRPTDSRWSVGRDSPVQPPELAGNPLVNGITGPLNNFFGSITGSVNDLFAIKNAFFVAQDFLVMAGWATALLLPCFIIAQVITSRQKRKELDILRQKIAALESALVPHSIK